jgi:hypothetical protein
VNTASGVTTVQIVYSPRRESQDLENIGPAHHEADVEVLQAVAR